MKIFKKILTVLLCIVIFLSATLCFTSYSLKHSIENSSVTGTLIADKEYCDLMYESVYEALEKKMALVIIEVDDISDIISKDTIADAAPLACASLVDRIFGGDSPVWKYENDELHERIDTLLSDYAAESGIEYEEGSADRVYEMICETVSGEMNVVPELYVSMISPVFSKIQSLCSYWYIFAIVFIASVAGVILLCKRHIKNALYNVILPSYLATFTVLCVSWILYGKDYLAKTILDGETFQRFLRQLYNVTLLDITKSSAVITVMLLIMGILVIGAIVGGKIRRRHHGRKHHSRDDANTEPTDNQ